MSYIQFLFVAVYKNYCRRYDSYTHDRGQTCAYITGNLNGTFACIACPNRNVDLSLTPNLFDPLDCIAPYFIILLCLTPDDFNLQRESTGTQWVNQAICLVNPLSCIAP